MTPKGFNLKVKPKPREKVTSFGLILVDTATPPSMEWGIVTDGNGLLPDGARVLYFGKKSVEREGEKIVNRMKVLYYV